MNTVTLRKNCLETESEQFPSSFPIIFFDNVKLKILFNFVLVPIVVYPIVSENTARQGH